LSGVWARGASQKIGTPYLFLRPLKLATSNLVHKLGLGLAYQKRRLGPKLAGIWARGASKKIWDPLLIFATAEARSPHKHSSRRYWKRPPGRPRRNWLQQVEEDIGLFVGAARIAGQDRSMWRTLRPSAGQAQQWVSEWVETAYGIRNPNTSYNHGLYDSACCTHSLNGNKLR